MARRGTRCLPASLSALLSCFPTRTPAAVLRGLPRRLMGAGQKRPRQGEDSEMDSEMDSGRGPRTGPDTAFFSPPVLRSAALTATGQLDRALFTKSFAIAAARVHDPRRIAAYQKALTKSRELLRVERLSSVVDDPVQEEEEEEKEMQGGPSADRRRTKRKCLLLQPGVSATAAETWSAVLREGVARGEVGVFGYTLTLGYAHWTAREVLVSVLPEAFHDDIPTGFNTAGHVAHLNLRTRFAPYKHVVGQVLLDKNAQLRTVINKTDLVGAASAFRTFGYEVLAGPDDLAVEVRENQCTFRFDYSKVYWNSKLEPEHTRLLQRFRPGEAVVDVMAGIGPFAVPAGKRGVFVWANDMNPHSHDALCAAVRRNKVAAFVRPFNRDGAVFVHQAADLVRAAAAAGEGADVEDPGPDPGPDVAASKKGPGGGRRRPPPPRRRVPVPPTVAHFVMNLPASAITFLPRFRGLYAGQEALFRPAADAADGTDSAPPPPPPLPMVHTHCFAAKNEEDPAVPKADVCARVSAELGVPMTLCARYADVESGGRVGGDDGDGDDGGPHRIYVHHVRAVAPHKSMFCASFRLPAAVAFAPRA